MAHRAVLYDSVPKLCDTVLSWLGFRCRGSMSMDTAVRESGDSMRKAYLTPQAGLCSYPCLEDTMSPPVSHRSPRGAVPYSHTTSQNTPGFHSLFLHRDTPIGHCPTFWSSSPMAQCLPSFLPWGCSFLNCKKLKVTVARLKFRSWALAGSLHALLPNAALPAAPLPAHQLPAAGPHQPGHSLIGTF